MALSPGGMLSHYRLVEKIGEGGMGEVWRADDTTLGRQVAIKILPESLAEDADRLSRFEREAKVLASLNHPGSATAACRVRGSYPSILGRSRCRCCIRVVNVLCEEN